MNFKKISNFFFEMMCPNEFTVRPGMCINKINVNMLNSNFMLTLKFTQSWRGSSRAPDRDSRADG